MFSVLHAFPYRTLAEEWRVQKNAGSSRKDPQQTRGTTSVSKPDAGAGRALRPMATNRQFRAEKPDAKRTKKQVDAPFTLAPFVLSSKLFWLESVRFDANYAPFAPPAPSIVA